MPGKRLSVDEARSIWNNRQLGKSVPELSQMFSVSRKTIYNVISRAKNEGRLVAKNGGGRKRKINKRSHRLIMRKIKHNPLISVRTLARELKEECGLIVSHETVRRAILRRKYPSGETLRNISVPELSVRVNEESSVDENLVSVIPTEAVAVKGEEQSSIGSPGTAGEHRCFACGQLVIGQMSLSPQEHDTNSNVDTFIEGGILTIKNKLKGTSTWPRSK